MKVLFLSLWYPNKYDAMSGLFVRKHAQAVAMKDDVQVIYLSPNNVSKKYELEFQEVNGVKELIIYYPNTTFIPLKMIRFLKAYNKGFKYIFKSWGKPNVTHVNVLMRHAFIAYYLKKRYQIPYVISEHWSRYLPQNFSYTGKIRRRLTEKVVANASAIMPVSTVLKDAMENAGVLSSQYHIVPNVVDDFFYETPAKATNRTLKRLLHISCFDERSKNVKGIVNAVKLLWQKRQDFEIVLAGTGTDFDMIKSYAEENLLTPLPISFVGEQTPQEIKMWFDSSDAFVLFSNYETAAVVIAESIVTGTPIISTPVGIAPKVVTPDVGIIVPIDDSEVLAEAMNFMLDHYQEYTPDIIKAKGSEFEMSRVGEQFHNIYVNALGSNHK